MTEMNNLSKLAAETEARLRKLASVRKVADIRPIENADAIEVAVVDGWQCVVKKGEFKPGDFCIYFEIDSFLPVKPEFEFLRKSSYKLLQDGTEGFRLKTVRLRGQLSQGLALPIEGPLLMPLLMRSGPGAKFSDFEGLDLTNDLGVTKWDPPVPACLSGDARGPYPSHSKTTDQERIQNLKLYFDLYKGEEFEISLKLDGSSCSFYYDPTVPDFGVCSRNINLKEDATNSFWKVANKYEINYRLKDLGRAITLQGELIGEGIQKNHERISGQDFFLFDIWDQELHRHLTSDERLYALDALNSIWGPNGGMTPIKHVPILGKMKIFNICDTLEALLEFVENAKAMNPGVTLEGLVFKSCRVINGEVVSFKAINNKYLLEEK